MPVRIFKFTDHNLNLRSRLKQDLCCFVCKKEIKIGDIIVTKKNKANPIRHEECARRIGLID
jgi:hypothetical protein